MRRRKIHNTKMAGTLGGTPQQRRREYISIQQTIEDWTPSFNYSSVKTLQCEWEFPKICQGDNVYYIILSW